MKKKSTEEISVSKDPIGQAGLNVREIGLIKIMVPQEWADYERREITNGDYFTLIGAVTYARKIAASETPLLKVIDRAHAAAAKYSNQQARYFQYAGFETGNKAHDRANHWWQEFETQMAKLRRGLRGES